jgi:hypothetical protein
VTFAPIAMSIAAYRPAAMTALGAATSGMQTAEARADGDASEIATNGPDVAPMVDLNVQKNTCGALAAVIRATDQRTGTAVDLLA